MLRHANQTPVNVCICPRWSIKSLANQWMWGFWTILGSTSWSENIEFLTPKAWNSQKLLRLCFNYLKESVCYDNLLKVKWGIMPTVALSLWPEAMVLIAIILLEGKVGSPQCKSAAHHLLLQSLPVFFCFDIPHSFIHQLFTTSSTCSQIIIFLPIV